MKFCLGFAFLVCAASLAAQDDAPTFGTTVVSTSGLQGKIYYLKPRTSKLPKFSEMKSAGTIYTSRLNIWPQEFRAGFPGITDRYEWFAIDYTGRFWVETPGKYGFSLLSDDGARLSIDNQDLIDNDGSHIAFALSGSASLSRGIHHLRVAYFQGPRYHLALVLAVEPPGAAWRIFDTNDFLPPKDETLWMDGTITDVRGATNGAATEGSSRKRR